MAENRMIGDYPVIGIRPTIDGRRTLATLTAARKVPRK